MTTDIRIGLDVDGVLANFVQGCIDFMVKDGLLPTTHKYTPAHVTGWNFAPQLDYHFSKIWKKLHLEENNDFWLNMPVIEKPPFVPAAYISARNIDLFLTSTWLIRNDFPVSLWGKLSDADKSSGNVFHVGAADSKIQVLKDQNIHYYVDDRPEHYQEINFEAGILCFLRDQPYNQHIDAGFLRIHSLEEVMPKIKAIERLRGAGVKVKAKTKF